MSFHKYQHIERLDKSDVQGLLDGEVYIFPKIDGTNASVWCDVEGSLHFGSRNRELSLDKDNAGFMAAGQDDRLKRGLIYIFQNLGADVTVYGEWLVPHKVTWYKDDAWKVFYVFDVFDRITGEYLHPRGYASIIIQAEEMTEGALRFVPPLKVCQGEFVTDELIQKLLAENTYMCAKDSGEGIVIKRYGYKNPWGNTIWGKVVSQDFNKEKIKVLYASPEKESLETKIIGRFFDTSVIEKEWLKCDVDADKLVWYQERLSTHVPFEPRYYPQLFERCFKTFITEESYEFIKWAKNPLIDYKRLWGAMVVAIKEYCDAGNLR